MYDKGLIAPNLASSIINPFEPENKSQFRFKKHLNSNEMKNFLIKGSIPVTLYSNMLTFRDSNKPFKLDGYLSEAITKYKLEC